MDNRTRDELLRNEENQRARERSQRVREATLRARMSQRTRLIPDPDDVEEEREPIVKLIFIVLIIVFYYLTGMGRRRRGRDGKTQAAAGEREPGRQHPFVGIALLVVILVIHCVRPRSTAD
ncbi:hypothetical protein B0T24DRAFT_725237 [Lasiosphaeria ovina]|uniref:Uncharacterized protein n=1 Tax=Lasiosphaeria ovina TaxID=92902 RepID=A0AAE0JRY1_9PEZI|nr:hypothetical protein B0T24DRAFT_725237 [Lasiosphaeria ovina]